MKRNDLQGREKRYRIRSVERALELLQVFSTEEPEFSLTELSHRLNLNTSTTFRLLATLENYGYIEQNSETGKYHLGVACLKLGSVFLSQVNLRQQALPLLEALRDECKETVHLTILDEMEVVYLEKLEGLLPIGLMSSRVGGRAPAHCTGVGKVLLAHRPQDDIRAFYSRSGLRQYTGNTIVDIDGLVAELSEVRQCGFAIDNEEHEPGVKCVAAPVYNHTGQTVGAISVSGPAERIDKNIAEADLIRKVMDTAYRISARLGCPGPSLSRYTKLETKIPQEVKDAPQKLNH